MNEATTLLKTLYDKANALNNKDAMLTTKYENDTKFARIHKRIKEKQLNVLENDTALHEVLLDIKHKTDETVLNNQAVLDNEDYFAESTKRTIMETLEEKGIRNLEIVRLINNTLMNEYFYERAA